MDLFKTNNFLAAITSGSQDHGKHVLLPVEILVFKLVNFIAYVPPITRVK